MSEQKISNNSHSGQILKQQLNKLNKPITHFARDLDMSDPGIHGWFKRGVPDNKKEDVNELLLKYRNKSEKVSNIILLDSAEKNVETEDEPKTQWSIKDMKQPLQLNSNGLNGKKFREIRARYGVPRRFMHLATGISLTEMGEFEYGKDGNYKPVPRKYLPKVVEVFKQLECIIQGRKLSRVEHGEENETIELLKELNDDLENVRDLALNKKNTSTQKDLLNMYINNLQIKIEDVINQTP